MKVIVTGASGQLGTELCRQLGRDAIGVDLPDVDITDKQQVDRIIEQHQPQVLINAAAYTQVDQAEAEPEKCFAVNEAAVATLADRCGQAGIRLVQISTDYVFGEDRNRAVPYREPDAPGPLSVYGKSKLEGEHEAARCPDHLIVRTCGLYAADAAGRCYRNFANTMLGLGQKRDSLDIVDDQWCTPSFVPHIAQAILRLVDSDEIGLFHLTNSGETTWCRFAAELFRQAKIKMKLNPITTADYGAPAPRPHYSVLACAKYEEQCSASLPPWQEGLSAYLGRS